MNQSPTFYQRHYLWVIAIFVLGIPALVWGMILSNRSNNNNIKQWLPGEIDATQDYYFFVDHFGTDEFALVSWRGCTLDDPRLTRFVEKVNNHRQKDGTDLFATVKSGPLLIETLTGKPFHLDRKDAIERLKGVAIGADGNLTGAIVQLTHEGDMNRRVAVQTMRRLAQEATGIVDEDEEANNGFLQLVWKLLEHVFAPPPPIGENFLHMAGDAVTNAEVDIASQQAILSLMHWCMAISLGCACFGLRKISLVFIVFFVSLYSSCLAESMVPWLGGNMNLILVVMPVLIYVLTLSAGVHIVNYYRDAAAQFGESGAPLRAVQHGWLPCTLAAGTTAIGLGSLCVSNIKPVKDFGVFASLGIMTTLVLLFLLLPSMLVASQRIDAWRQARRPSHKVKPRKPPSLRAEELATRCGRWVVNWHVTMVTACTAVLIFFGIGVFWINTSVKPARFFDAESRLIKDYRWLADEDRFGPQVPIELIVDINKKDAPLNTLDQLELVDALQDHLKQIPIVEGDVNGPRLIGSTMSAVTFAPPLKDLLGRERFITNERLEKNREAFRKVSFYSDFEATPEVEPGSESESNADTVQHELWRISARVARTDKDYDEIVRAVREDVNEFLEQRRQDRETQVQKHMQSFESNLATVEEKLQQMNVAPDQLEAHRANELFNIENVFQRQINALLVDALKPKADELVAQFKAARGDLQKEAAFVKKAVAMIDDTDGVSITYTGMVPLFHEAQNELLTSLFESFLLAFVLIWVLMIIWFRSVSAGFVTMLPNIFPAAIIFGFMGWTGRIVDIGSMMTASVAMGIAVDDTVHYLTWFRRGLSEGKPRIDALLHAYRRCAIAMTQTTMIAGFGIVVFWLSPFQPVSQFGLLMFVLLIAALVGDLVFLPAMLAGPAGRLFQPKDKAESIAAAETQPVA